LSPELNDLRTVGWDASGDLGATGAGNDDPARFAFGHLGLEISAAAVLRKEGFEVL